MCRQAHPKATQTLLIMSQTATSPNPSQHHQTNTLDFADVDVSSKMFPRVARSRDGVGVPSLVQAAFRVCVGVRSGPKGPVIDISMCGVAPGPLANYIEAVGYVRRGSRNCQGKI